MLGPKYTVTNDMYSNQPVDGTIDELQESFDSIGWDVKLAVNGDELYDENNGETVGELSE